MKLEPVSSSLSTTGGVTGNGNIVGVCESNQGEGRMSTTISLLQRISIFIDEWLSENVVDQQDKEVRRQGIPL